MNLVANPDSGRPVRPVSLAGADAVRDALRGILADGVDVHRCLAAKALGRIGGVSASQSLIQALMDEDEDVRTDAAEALAVLAPPEAADQLFGNLLGDPCTEVKLAAIRTLAKLQDRRIVPWLRRMAKGRDEEIVWDDQEFFDSGWDDWMEIQLVSIAALGEMRTTEAVPDIVAAIRDEDAQDMTETAFKALARMGSAGIAALTEFLDPAEPVRLRRRAASVLAGLTAEDVAAPLARAFADASAEVRGAAMRARAAAMPDEAGLERFLDDPAPDVRAEAARLCGQRRPERLVAMLDDPARAVQIAALAALARAADRSGCEAPVEKLRSLIALDNARISAAATSALGAIAPDEAAKDLAALLGDTARSSEVRLAALRGLGSIGGAEAVAALVRAIDDDARIVRLEVMSALARLARANTRWPNAAGDALLEALRGRYSPEPDDDTPSGSVAVAETEPEAPLPESADADKDAFPTSTLKAILEDNTGLRKTAGLPDEGFDLTPDDMERLALARKIVGKKRVSLEPNVVVHDDIRRLAARVLGDLHKDDVARELATALSSPDADLRVAAADSLSRIAATSAPLDASVDEKLLAALPKADRDMKVLLIRALAASQDDLAGDAVKAQLADGDGFVRTEAVRALASLKRTGPETEALLDDPDASTRLAAAEVLARQHDDGAAITRLVDYAFEHEGLHRRETARLLRDIDPNLANSAFLDALHDQSRKRVWAVAIEALEEINRS